MPIVFFAVNITAGLILLNPRRLGAGYFGKSQYDTWEISRVRVEGLGVRTGNRQIQGHGILSNKALYFKQ
jgi:hypothetical protein